MTASETVTPIRSGKPTDDTLELHKSGTVRTTIEGTTYLLKRPKVGEFRTIREAFQALAEAAAQAAENAKTTKEAGGEPTQIDQSDDLLAWMRLVFDLLADKSLPADNDDLPTWFLDSSLPASLIGHWRAVPLAHGSL